MRNFVNDLAVAIAQNKVSDTGITGWIYYFNY